MGHLESAVISPPIHAQMQTSVDETVNHIKNLFAYRFQVLPFIYTHLVSTCSTIYLVYQAFYKGQYFDPQADVGYGLAVPLCGTILTTITTYGLLEVGNTILDPFGDDPEDFALLHFVESAAPSGSHTPHHTAHHLLPIACSSSPSESCAAFPIACATGSPLRPRTSQFRSSHVERA